MDGYRIAYAVELFGGLALILVSGWWMMKNPRRKGTPLAGLRRRMLMLTLLGTLLFITGVFGLMRQ